MKLSQCGRRIPTFVTFILLATRATAADLPKHALHRMGSTHFRPSAGASLESEAVSDDGRRLAVVSRVDRGNIEIYDLANGDLLKTVTGEPGQTWDGTVCFSKDGSHLIVAEGSKWVTEIVLATGVRTKRFEFNRPRSIAISPDNKLIAVNIGREVELRDWSSGKRIWTKPVTRYGIREKLSFSADGSLVGYLTDRRYDVWSVDEGALQSAVLPDGENPPKQMNLALSIDLRNGVRLNETNQRLELFETRNNQVIRTIDIPAEINFKPYGNGVFLRGGREFAIEMDRDRYEIQIFDLTTGQLVRSLERHFEKSANLLASADGSILIAVSNDRIWVWDYETGRLRDYSRGAVPVEQVAISQSNEVIVSVCDDSFNLSKNRLALDGVRFWKSATGELLHWEPDWCFAGFADEGKSAWMWRRDGKLRKLDLQTFEGRDQQWVFEDDETGIELTKSEPTKSQIAATKGTLQQFEVVNSQSGNIYFSLWKSTELLDTKAELKIKGDGWARSVDGRRFDYIFFDGGGVSSNRLMEFKTANRGTSVGFLVFGVSIDERSGLKSLHRVGVLRKSVAEKALWIEADPEKVQGFAISHDGQTILTSSLDMEDKDQDRERFEIIGFWSVPTGKLICEKKIPQFVEKLRTGLILHYASQLALSPDGRYFAAGRHDGQTSIWSVQQDDPKPKVTLDGHQQAVSSITFSTDGRRLVTGSLDTTVLLYDMTFLNAQGQ